MKDENLDVDGDPTISLQNLQQISAARTVIGGFDLELETNEGDCDFLCCMLNRMLQEIRHEQLEVLVSLK